MAKDLNYNRFKSIIGISFIIVLLLSFLKLIVIENESIQLHSLKFKLMPQIMPQLKKP